MKYSKRKSLKRTLLFRIVLYGALIVCIITAINMSSQSSRINSLSKALLSKESVSYAAEVYNWWNSIEERVGQIANVYNNTPQMSDADTLNMLL